MYNYIIPVLSLSLYFIFNHLLRIFTYRNNRRMHSLCYFILYYFHLFSARNSYKMEYT